MGAQQIIEKLDTEIQTMEKAIWPDQSPKEPAVSDAADQTAQGSDQPVETQTPAATGPSDQYEAGQNTFDVDQSISTQSTAQTTGQEEPTSQKQRVSWKSRYVKLKQYHDADKFKTRTLLGQAYDKITELEAENKRLAKNFSDLVKVNPKTIKDLATQEEIDRIGEDELAIMDRLTSQKLDAQTKDLQDRLDKADAREAEARQIQSKNAKAEAYNIFLERLGAAVPDYAEVDVDPRFEHWLEQPDPMSGFKRIDLFKQAEASGDVGRVATFFNDFKKEVSPTQQTLDNKVTPVGNSGSSRPVNNQQNMGRQEIVPMAEYVAFMDSVTRGGYKGRETEAKTLEAKYDKAIAEGRLR